MTEDQVKQAAIDLAVEAQRIYDQREGREPEGYDGAFAERIEDVLTTVAAEARLEGVRSVVRIRCVDHRDVEAMNANDASGGECGACAAAEALEEAAREFDVDEREWWRPSAIAMWLRERARRLRGGE